VYTIAQVNLIPFSENASMITENNIYISRDLFTKWKLEEGKIISFYVGKQFLSLNTFPIESAENQVQLPKTIMEKLYLPIKEYQFYAEFNVKRQFLILAPFIGLITEIAEEQFDSPHFRSIHSFCEELHHVTDKWGGFFFVFPLQPIVSDSITGYYYQEEQWLKSKLPLPNVIYNRIHSRRLEASPIFQTFRKELDAQSIPMFNNRFLSKWDVHGFIMSEDHLKPYIPYTHLYSKQKLSEMLSNFSLLFMKPIHGSQGRNIIRIERLEHGYDIQFSYFKEKQANIFVTTEMELLKIVEVYAQKSSYILQQGIPFIHFQGRHIDFRVLCHKRKNDNWNVTSVVARLSAEQQFVSNISRGGDLLKPLKALSLFFDVTTSEQLFVYLKELAVELASVISFHSNGFTGELGIDIGIDLNGHPWIIEVNSKPSKNREEQEIKVRPSAKAIISYCHLLALEQYTQEEENG
jgi:hypothetical protein